MLTLTNKIANFYSSIGHWTNDQLVIVLLTLVKCILGDTMVCLKEMKMFESCASYLNPYSLVTLAYPNIYALMTKYYNHNYHIKSITLKQFCSHFHDDTMRFYACNNVTVLHCKLPHMSWSIHALSGYNTVATKQFIDKKYLAKLFVRSN